MKNVIVFVLATVAVLEFSALCILVPDNTIKTLQLRDLAQLTDANGAKIIDLTDRLIFIESALTFEGTASWYGNKEHGRIMANGKRFDQFAKTIATKFLPFGKMKWKVTRTDTGATTIVESTDDGPNVKGRIADLSFGAASELGMIQPGVVPVSIRMDLSGKVTS
jgi:rare lipoprotein A (peptidoglycan hydrolase)